MRFVSGCYYRHSNCLDVDIRVIKRQFVGELYTKLKVDWVDRNHTGHYQLGESIKILKKDYSKWKCIL